MSNKKNSDNKSNKKQNTKNMKINEWPRHGIQALWAFITNSHVTGFVTGKIYTGKLKNETMEAELQILRKSHISAYEAVYLP